MKWEGNRESDNVEDRRGSSGRSGGGLFGSKFGIGSIITAQAYMVAHESRQILQTGDIEEAMNAAARIGDDAIQRQSTGHVGPDSFTLGSSAQRTKWFNIGLQTGSVKACDTFSQRDL